MVLNGNSISKLIKNINLIENANFENVRSASYDVTSTNKLLVIKNFDNPISFIDAKTIDNLYEEKTIENGYNLKPKESVLIPIKEFFNIPNNLSGHFRGRTSFNRLGLILATQHINPRL